MARHDEGFFTAKDHLRLFWTLDLPEAEPRAHVALVHGYADHIGRYRPVTEALVADGFAVHGFDYRGHGRADGRRGYCDKWPDYLDDLALFWERVRKAAGGQKAFLLGHSHGGLMAAHLAAAGRAGGHGRAGAVSPLLQAGHRSSRLEAARRRALVGKVVPWLPIQNELKPEHLTRDTAIVTRHRRGPALHPHRHPALVRRVHPGPGRGAGPGRSGDSTHFHLLRIERRRGRAGGCAVLLRDGGSTDKKFKEYPGMLHEPLNEVGREEVFRDISGWISAHL